MQLETTDYCNTRINDRVPPHSQYYSSNWDAAVPLIKYEPRSQMTKLPTSNETLEYNDELPIDPRNWSRADVWKWLETTAMNEGLSIVANEIPKKFPMNGKALCLMSLDMYLSRVPVGGKMLYRDFRTRLARAMAIYH